MLFANFMNWAIEQSGVSNYKLAKRLGISQTTVANWLNGVTEPRKRQRAEVLDVFGVDEEDLEQGFPIIHYKDEPAEIDKEEKSVASESETRWQELHSNFDKLNDLGQEYLIEYSDFLLSKEKYQKAALSGKTERIFRAARSEDNTPPEWVDMPVEEVERIFNAPESKTNL